MSGDKAASGRKTGFLWVASIVATALVTLVITLYFQNASLLNGGASSSKLQAIVTDMRMNLVRSAEKEKCAVMSKSDEQSANFAEQSRSAARAVERDLKKLEAIIATSDSEKQKKLVGRFAESWKAVQEIDTGLLEKAMQNTNVKALNLAETIGVELQQKMDTNLVRLTATVGPEWKKAQMDKIAGDARLAIRSVALFQMRHINAATESDKKHIEAAIQSEKVKVNAALKTLDKMTGKKSRPYIRDTITCFDEYMRVSDEIVRLSVLNTNKSTEAISLEQKRMAEAECDRALEALLKLAAGKP